MKNATPPPLDTKKDNRIKKLRKRILSIGGFSLALGFFAYHYTVTTDTQKLLATISEQQDEIARTKLALQDTQRKYDVVHNWAEKNVPSYKGDTYYQQIEEDNIQLRDTIVMMEVEAQILKLESEAKSSIATDKPEEAFVEKVRHLISSKNTYLMQNIFEHALLVLSFIIIATVFISSVVRFKRRESDRRAMMLHMRELTLNEIIQERRSSESRRKKQEGKQPKKSK